MKLWGGRENRDRWGKRQVGGRGEANGSGGCGSGYRCCWGRVGSQSPPGGSLSLMCLHETSDNVLAEK